MVGQFNELWLWYGCKYYNGEALALREKEGRRKKGGTLPFSQRGLIRKEPRSYFAIVIRNKLIEHNINYFLAFITTKNRYPSIKLLIDNIQWRWTLFFHSSISSELINKTPWRFSSSPLHRTTAQYLLCGHDFQVIIVQHAPSRIMSSFICLPPGGFTTFCKSHAATVGTRPKSCVLQAMHRYHRMMIGDEVSQLKPQAHESPWLDIKKSWYLHSWFQYSHGNI